MKSNIAKGDFATDLTGRTSPNKARVCGVHTHPRWRMDTSSTLALFQEGVRSYLALGGTWVPRGAVASKK